MELSRTGPAISRKTPGWSDGLPVADSKDSSRQAEQEVMPQQGRQQGRAGGCTAAGVAADESRKGQQEVKNWVPVAARQQQEQQQQQAGGYAAAGESRTFCSQGSSRGTQQGKAGGCAAAGTAAAGESSRRGSRRLYTEAAGT